MDRKIIGYIMNFIIALFLFTGCAGQQIKSGEKYVEEGNIPKALSSYFDAEKNDNYRALACLRIAQIFEKELKQFDTALEYYEKARSEIQLKSQERDTILTETQNGIKSTIESKFNHLERKKFHLSVKSKPNAKYYRLQSSEMQYKDHEGKNGFKFICDEKFEIIKDTIYVRDRKSGVYYSLEEIENIAASDPMNKSTNYSIITAYKNFLKKHPNQGYEERAKKRIDDLSFSVAEKENSINSYHTYLSEFPNGKYAGKVKSQIEYLYFNEIKSKDKISAYEDYLGRYPNGSFKAKATNRIEELYFEQKKKSDTISAYEDYLGRYPNGSFKAKATNRIEELYFEQKKKSDTLAAYQEYLTEYPSGNYASIARSKIEEIENWEETKKKDDAIHYKSYLELFPNSKFNDEAKARIHYLEILKSDSVDDIKDFLSNYRVYSYNYSKVVNSGEKKRVLERLELISSEQKSSSGFALLYEETNKSEYLNLAFALIKDKYDEEYFAKNFPYKFFGVKSLNPYDRTDTDTKYGLFGGTTYIGSVRRGYNPTIHSGAKYGTYKVKIKFSLKTETIKKYFGIAWFCPDDEEWSNTYTEYATFVVSSGSSDTAKVNFPEIRAVVDYNNPLGVLVGRNSRTTTEVTGFEGKIIDVNLY
ncbi:hypothetical protein QUF75_01520 [Desulfococcaceae bacterium HSG7]|nr:hypothetical protein [Desulfococcaceae bacterium HSG7]